MASLLAGSQVLVCSSEGMGKTFLANQIYEALLGESFNVGLLEPSSSKQLLVEIADLLGVSTKNLEGRSLSTDALKVAIADRLSNNVAILIFENAHLLEAKFRHWLKNLKRLGVPMLLTATDPPRSDIFLNLPRIELRPLPDYAIREIMEVTALDRGINLKPREFARLLERTGGNPLLAQRAIEEELLGIDLEAGDHNEYLDITPIILLIGVIFIAYRFIGLGTGNQSLYILAGIGAALFMGVKQVIMMLPRETKRITQ